MIHFLYKTTCKENGKYYIGMHSTECEDDGYLGSGTILKKAVIKYGADVFSREILSYHETREDLTLAELKVLDNIPHNSHDCYNIIKGGKRIRGNHDEDIFIFNNKMVRNSDTFYHIEVVGELFKGDSYVHRIIKGITKRIAQELTDMYNDARQHKYAKKTLEKTLSYCDYPENIKITEMPWECEINL